MHPDYLFCTVRSLPFARSQVWDLLGDPLRWPEWWPGLVDVQVLPPGSDDPPGWTFAWRGQLPYTLRISILLVERVERIRMVGRVRGTLNGSARWELEDDGDGTNVRFEWQVSGPRWSRRVAPLLRGSFRRNFDGLMLQGFDGMSQHLAARAQGA